jgi:hypothetical protein
LLRHIATGALVLGSAIALLVGSATYAPFNDSATGAGHVAAGSVLVTVNGSDTATFDFSSAECSNMAPGIDCAVEVVVSAADSSLSAVWDTTITETGDEPLPDLPDGCFTETLDIPTGDAEEGDPDADHDPGDSHTGTLTVRVTDDNACQSAATDLTVSVVATQSPSPHN